MGPAGVAPPRATVIVLQSRGHCLLQRRMCARDSTYQAAVGNCGNESARCLGLPWSQNECGVTGERCFNISLRSLASSLSPEVYLSRLVTG